MNSADGPSTGRISHRAICKPELAGCRLDQAAASLFDDYSRARLQKWIKRGELTVNGKPSKTTAKLAGGEVLVIDATADRQETVKAENIPLDIVHQDDDLIVVNKPAGLVVHPAAGNRDGTLQNALLHFDPGLEGIPRSGIVHRLDKETTGIMVVARSLRAHTSLVNQLQARSMSRIYEAIAKGAIRRSGTVNERIGRHPRDRKRMAVVSSGRKAVTHYRILKQYTGFTHLEVSLETGRTHQIRVHLAHLGHPLVGDKQYGRKPRSVKGLDPEVLQAVQSFPRQALHARTLRLSHPANGLDVSYSAPLPVDIQLLLHCLDDHLRG